VIARYQKTFNTEIVQLVIFTSIIFMWGMALFIELRRDRRRRDLEGLRKLGESLERRY
jgi:hypothetical protein